MHNKEKDDQKKEIDSRLAASVQNKLKQSVERRSFLKTASVAAAAALLPSPKADALSFEQFFQKHYKKMDVEDKKKVFARIKRETKIVYGADINLSDPRPIKNTKFVYCLNLSACNGSRKCVTACAEENNIDPEMGSYIQVLEMPIGSMNPEKGNLHYEGKSVPKDGKYYLPVQCHQCENPPCAKVCPIEATWKEEDGIVVVDYDWCIGCRYCQSACPYEARRFNFKTPKLEMSRINTQQSYLSNRMRAKGVMEKCTFCLQRTREGHYPACLEACPTGARKFGNILDSMSEVSQIFRHKKVFVLKEELNTIPQFFYYFDG